MCPESLELAGFISGFQNCPQRRNKKHEELESEGINEEGGRELEDAHWTVKLSTLSFRERKVDLQGAGKL